MVSRVVKLAIVVAVVSSMSGCFFVSLDPGITVMDMVTVTVRATGVDRI